MDVLGAGLSNSKFTVASAAGTRDSSVTAEMIKGFLSVDQVVNRIVRRTQLDSVEREVGLKEIPKKRRRINTCRRLSRRYVGN
jgi:hypothetical protein